MSNIQSPSTDLGNNNSSKINKLILVALGLFLFAYVIWSGYMTLYSYPQQLNECEKNLDDKKKELDECNKNLNKLYQDNK